MGMVKNIALLGFLLLILFSAQPVSAGILPNSSHYEGTSHYSVGGLKGYIDFAVYDTQDFDGDEFAASIGDTAPGVGRYIYAYQIFTNSASTNIIDYFEVFRNGSTAAISDSTANIGAVSDSLSDPAEAGVNATKSSFNLSLTKGVWQFSYGGEHIQPTEHSVFLVLRSNSDWISGNYRFTPSTSDELSIPDSSTTTTTTVPEPVTLVLLGSAGLAVFNRMKK
jgi:hypothetical protein